MILPAWASNLDSPITIASSAYRDATNSATEADHIIGHFGDNLTGHMTQPTVSQMDNG